MISDVESSKINLEIQNLCTSKSCDEILKKCVEIFDVFRSNCESSDCLDPFKEFESEIEESHTHSKLNLIHQETSLGPFNVDLIRFKKDNWTGVHTHSPYVVEQIIRGSLMEQVGENQMVRETNDRRESFDPKGLMHNVSSLADDTVTLCLSLGHMVDGQQ